MTGKIEILGVEDTVAVHDADAEIYEVFADKDLDSYLGCADSIPECKQIARDWVAQHKQCSTPGR